MNVLIIDRDPRARAQAERLLEAEGHRVVSCEPQEALQRCERAELRADVVLIDAATVEANGGEIHRCLKNHPATQESRILCVSAAEGHPDLKTGLAAGCDAYVVKPYPEGLLGRLVSQTSEVKGRP